MLTERWVAELERYGGVRVNAVRYNTDTDGFFERIPWIIRIHRGDLPRGIGSFYAPPNLLGRLLQPFMLWLYVREVRRAVLSERGQPSCRSTS